MKLENKKTFKKNLLNILVLIVLIAITLISLIASNKELNFKNISQFLHKSKPLYLVLAFICMLLFIFFEGLAIYRILRKMGVKGRQFAPSMIYSSADIYYSAITPSATGGQPASVYYMTKSGIDVGTASISLVFNLTAYISAILIIGVMAFALRWKSFLAFDVFPKILIILGIFMQVLLLLFFIGCMYFDKLLLKAGNGLISLLGKMHIIKNKEKWTGKLYNAIQSYHDSFNKIKQYHGIFLEILIYNILQRVSQILINCFVCMAAAPESNIIDLFALQSFVVLGYNCLPLPGGVGAYEYLYINIFGGLFAEKFILSAMMVSRVISYYICIIISGIMTLGYHVLLMRKKSPVKTEEKDGEREETNGARNEKKEEMGSSIE